MIGKMDPPEKVHAGGNRAYGYFIRMHGEFELVSEESLHQWQNYFEMCTVLRYNSKVIGVADIIFCLELVLYELIEFVHVDIYKKL